MASAPKERLMDEEQTGSGHQGWFRFGLGLGGAVFTQELSSGWAEHLNSVDFYPLSLAVGMSLYNYHIFRLTPPSDPSSRLKALWLPEEKRKALIVTAVIVIMSLVYGHYRLNKTVSQITFERIESLRPIKRGIWSVSGQPVHQEQPYRWVFEEHSEVGDAPYLTPLKEFKGQLLVVSNEPLAEAISSKKGWLTELSTFSRPHYAAYRNYMGVSPNAPIYLFDLRGIWWFDPYGFAGVITALVLFWGTASSATRDASNSSRRLYIPEDLRNDDLEISQRTSTQDHPENSEQSAVMSAQTETDLDQHEAHTSHDLSNQPADHEADTDEREGEATEAETTEAEITATSED